MDFGTVNDLLRREPFQPFRLKLSNGGHVDVRNPALVVPMKRDVFIADAKRDRFHLYSLLHVVGVESMSRNGSRRRKAG